jgi:hypothetical protein
MEALVRREEAESGLLMKGSVRQCLASVEASGEEGRRADEGWLRCGMFQGRVSPFIGPGVGAEAVGKGGGMAGVTTDH